MLMAARAACARRRLDAPHNRAARDAAFFCMTAIQADALKIRIGEIQAHTGCLQQLEAFFSAVHDTRRTHEHGCISKDRIQQEHLHTALRIRELDFQCLGLGRSGIRSWQTLQSWLAGKDTMALVEKLRYSRTICPAHLIGRNAEITMSEGRIFLRQDIQGKCTFILIGSRLRRKTAVDGLQSRCIAVFPQCMAPVTMQQILAAHQFNYITEHFILQMEKLLFLIKIYHNRHLRFPSSRM